MIILVTQHISIYFLSPLLVLFDLLKNRSVCDSDTTDVAQIVARLHGYVLKSSCTLFKNNSDIMFFHFIPDRYDR